MLDLSALNVFEWTVLGLYGFFMLFIFSYSLIQLELVLRYRLHKRKTCDISMRSYFLSKVTVQLPIYNERYVAGRLIDCVAQLDYPRELLEIQVLDDSNDETVELIQEKVGFYRSKGLQIHHIQRPARVGFKAGALQYGLERANGEFIAIFDADFLPPSDFLRSVMGEFEDERIGMVQTRWGHLNRDYNMLTSLQAFGLDAHFTVEQSGRNQAGYFINFNGTAGVWRKSTIEDAGGWSSDTLTEDLDLSYRAQLKGWRFKFREDVAAPAELPVEMNALKGQQFRWTKGAAECAVKNLRSVISASGISIHTKLHAFFHLMNSFIFIAVLCVSLLSIPLLYIKQDIASLAFVQSGSLFLVSLVFLVVFYWQSFGVAQKGRGVGAFTRRFFPFLSMSMGMSLHNAIAVFEGYSGKKSPFIRTPKYNVVGESGDWFGSMYRLKSVSPLAWLEMLLSLIFFLAALTGVYIGDMALLPFHGLLSLGFGTVGYYTLRHARIA